MTKFVILIAVLILSKVAAADMVHLKDFSRNVKCDLVIFDTKSMSSKKIEMKNFEKFPYGGVVFRGASSKISAGAVFFDDSNSALISMGLIGTELSLTAGETIEEDETSFETDSLTFDTTKESISVKCQLSK